MLQNFPLIKRIYTSGDITGTQQMHVAARTSLWRRLQQVPRGLKLILALRRESFDLVVDFRGTDRSAIFAFLCGAPERIGYTARGGAGFFRKDRLYTHVCHNTDKRKHSVLKDLELLRSFALATGRAKAPGQELSAGPLVLNPVAADLSWAEAQWTMMAVGGARRLVVHPTSRVLYKCWAPAMWAAVIDRLQAEFNATVLVTSGPEAKELELARTITGLCSKPIHTRLGDLSLGQLAALIQRADLFLGVDTAPMHMAAAVGTPVVAVFGPSNDLIWAPWGPGHCVVRRPCACLEAGQQRCQEAQGMDCLNSLTADEVYQAARTVLAGLKPRNAELR
jgi:heptosyltransferase-3